MLYELPFVAAARLVEVIDNDDGATVIDSCADAVCTGDPLSFTETVNVAVPPRSPAGTYSYRLDVVSVAKPDEGDSSQPTRFTVTETAPPPKKWGLIAAIVAVVVIVAGV